eukprot:gnl/Dysnectes_brevis/5184_a7348_668.p1 GENE.gnl/Dysnectes_brevis/5184_a7348_668~~gnl/Dysnectes_brevis/5184_a7348_668.p1  ORF type:complete len:279 (+),score=21.93 gnl/Dysnectes_brevis/5184_a7348_668:94-837(+)
MTDEHMTDLSELPAGRPLMSSAVRAVVQLSKIEDDNILTGLQTLHARFVSKFMRFAYPDGEVPRDNIFMLDGGREFGRTYRGSRDLILQHPGFDSGVVEWTFEILGLSYCSKLRLGVYRYGGSDSEGTLSLYGDSESASESSESDKDGDLDLYRSSISGDLSPRFMVPDGCLWRQNSTSFCFGVGDTIVLRFDLDEFPHTFTWSNQKEPSISHTEHDLVFEDFRYLPCVLLSGDGDHVRVTSFRRIS